LVFCLLSFLSSIAQDRTISGTVTDAVTGKPLVSCSVYLLHSGNGGITNENGYYALLASGTTDSVAVSTIGYVTLVKPIGEKRVINFELEPHSSALGSLTVTARSKYSRAQLLIRKVIRNKPVNDVYARNSFQCRVYDKIEVDVKNIPKRIQHNFLVKPLAFVFTHMDSTEDHQKILPIYLSESRANYYYSQHLAKDKYDYEAAKSSGVPNYTVLAYIDGIHKRINVYNDDIKLEDINFVSPIANDALSFYHYRIIDTAVFNGHQCIQVEFNSTRYGSNTFQGYLWVVDSSFAVRSLVMHLDKNSNINWVRRFDITENFVEDSFHRFVPAKNIIYVDLNMPVIKGLGAIAKKTTLFKDVVLDGDQMDSVFDKPTTDFAAASAKGSDTTYWSNNRFEPLNKSERFAYELADTIGKIPAVVFYGKVISALYTGYYRAGKFDWGNIYNAYTYNYIEQNRFNAAFRTNKFFNKNFQLNAYGGYSTGDSMARYAADAIFVLGREPWSTLTLAYSNDIEASNNYFDEVDQNSIFASFLRRINDNIRLVNNRTAVIDYSKYFYNDFAFGARARTLALTPYFNVYYANDGFSPYIFTNSKSQLEYRSNELSATIRYAHGEKYVLHNYSRISLGSTYPVLSFTYTKGIKINNGLLASNFDYNKFKFVVSQDFPDGRLGELSYTLRCAITQGVLPIVLLDVQKGNDTYYYDQYAFNNMNLYEFVADKSISLHAEQRWGSFPFNKIPGLRKLKWRSLTTFNAVWGGMSDANKQANSYYDTTTTYHFYVPGNVPYIEAGVGIANIFKLIRIDGIWRLTYRNNPEVPKFGLKASIELKL
jgi:uncharacterized protein DUF5686/carboxypeptidase-like protein